MAQDWPPPDNYNKKPDVIHITQQEEDDLSDKVLDAYKVNPMLGAMLILNLAIIGGVGWYMFDRDEKSANYIESLQKDMTDLRNRALDLAYNCSQKAVAAPAPAPAPRYTEQPLPPQRPPQR